jgi:hypothetical protein
METLRVELGEDKTREDDGEEESQEGKYDFDINMFDEETSWKRGRKQEIRRLKARREKGLMEWLEGVG